ncbi:transcriptional regulator of RNA polII, SAGA, subunit-domain-containing protein [Lipomyces japonicus]|uniref:transcriptional regulator of RNA polII, SAGA, subunit-domain-containing protein n=1 Tax=Lipomyces japonicus TaxID=56871 RepID=UPI0034CDD071
MNGTSLSRSSPQPIVNKRTSSSLSVTLMANSNGGNVSTNHSAAPAPSTTTTTSNTPVKPQRPARRIEIEPLMNGLKRALDDKWSHYRDVITAFLTGRLSRIELESELSQLLDRSMVRMHNQFLLASVANSLRDPPPSMNGLVAWRKAKEIPVRVNKHGVDPLVAKLKGEIMGLTPRERRRIKAITRDAGKKGPVPSTIVLTRQAKLPLIPNSKDNKDKIKSSINHNNIAQEIQQGYQTPLSTESYELPDNESLRTRILGIAHEHGLVDGIANDVPDIILAGLEYHLRDFLQQILDRVRPRAHKRMTNAPILSVNGSSIIDDAIQSSVNNNNNNNININRIFPKRRKAYEEDNVITAEDMALALELAPHSIVEPSGPVYRLLDVMLQDEIDDLQPNVDEAKRIKVNL